MATFRTTEQNIGKLELQFSKWKTRCLFSGALYSAGTVLRSHYTVDVLNIPVLVVAEKHDTATSSRCWQLCTPQSLCEHSSISVSVPTHRTLSNQIGPLLTPNRLYILLPVYLCHLPPITVTATLLLRLANIAWQWSISIRHKHDAMYAKLICYFMKTLTCGPLNHR